jgi:predicted transcriptional regulator
MREVAARGERNGMARLGAREVLAVKLAVAGGATQASVAASFGVNQSTVSRILSGVRWAHLEG